MTHLYLKIEGVRSFSLVPTLSPPDWDLVPNRLISGSNKNMLGVRFLPTL